MFTSTAVFKDVFTGGPKPYKFIRFGDIHGPTPYKFIGFGDIHGPKPYKFIGFGDTHGPRPYKFIGFGDIQYMPDISVAALWEAV